VLTTISTKGQIVIPQELRERKNLNPGDELEIEDTAAGLLIRKKRRNEGLVAHLLKLKGTGLKIPRIRGRVEPSKF
jgi:AbrB family looped-hinge helix DNA binding protein